MVRAAKMAMAAAILLGTVGAVKAFGDFDKPEDAPGYRLGTVTRGPIVATVAASGTLKAVVTVDVGSQVSGMIKTLHADFNSEVRAGDVVARIDSAPFEARLSEAEAEHAVARANLAMQEASLEEADADVSGLIAGLTAANEELRRKRELFQRGVERSAALDAAVAVQEQADAKVKGARARLSRQKAQIELARGQVMQKAAVVQQRRLDLDYTYIRSPVSGVIISRNVDAGQTVAASLQAPILFRIAEDLSRMQVGVSVDEADIGRVAVGQRVQFGVDAFPDRTFEGRVQQIRKSSQELSNVVTYTVVVSAANEHQLLLPGMTASVRIVVGERGNALQVPNAALSLHVPERRDAEPNEGNWVWLVGPSSEPRLVRVATGLSNMNQTEVVQGSVQEGEAVIIGIAAPRPANRWRWLRPGS